MLTFSLSRLFTVSATSEIPRMQRGLPKKFLIPGVSKVLVVASGKGGVGKSTVAVNLAVALSQMGQRVGLLDADLFGPSIPRMMNLKSPLAGLAVTSEKQLIPLVNYGVKCMSMGFLVGESAPIVWRGLMVMKAIEQLLRQVSWAPLDLLVVDMPPGTGDTQLSISQLIPLYGALIVTTPQDVAVTDARKGVEMFHKVRVPIMGLVNNMSSFICSHCNESTEIHRMGPDNNLERLQTDLSIPILANIPIEPEISNGGDSGMPTVLSHPQSLSAKAFKQIAVLLSLRLFKK